MFLRSSNIAQLFTSFNYLAILVVSLYIKSLALFLFTLRIFSSYLLDDNSL